MPDKKPKVVIRADGNREIGFGHVFRCLALAQMLNKDFECWFYIQNPEPFLKAEIEKVVYGINELPNESNFGIEARQLTQHALNGDEIVVLDGYHFDLDYQKAIKANGNPLVFIDDLAEQHFVADVVINHAGGIQENEYSIESYTKLLLGPRYALIRTPFVDRAKETRILKKQIEKVFISLGGIVQNKLIEDILEGLMNLSESREINILGGSEEIKESYASSNLESLGFKINHYTGLDDKEVLNLMGRCQLAIAPASTLSYELISVGIGIITGYTYHNQVKMYNGLINNDVVIGVGNIKETDSCDWQQVFKEFDLGKMNEQVLKQKNFIDGYSGIRLINELKSLI